MTSGSAPRLGNTAPRWTNGFELDDDDDDAADDNVFGYYMYINNIYERVTIKPVSNK